jgi:S1-C subfamily serine protease
VVMPDALGTASGSDVGSQPVSYGGDVAVDVSRVVDGLRQSVVKIAVVADDAGAIGSGIGTGVIVTADGEILTNAHVVAQAAAIRVLMPGATEPTEATLRAIDISNDLALLKVDASGLKAISFADSDELQVGDAVVAMGYALDLEGDASVTSGIVSALNRSMLTDEGALNNLLQTDTAISSGNSGGPLVNSSGQLVGINTAVARSSATSAANNIGFALTSNEVQRVLELLRNGKQGTTSAQGYLGIGLQARRDGGRGAIVSEVQSGSPAAELGLVVGDVINSIDGAPIDGQAGLIGAIRDRSPGATVSIEYTRHAYHATERVNLPVEDLGL